MRKRNAVFPQSVKDRHPFSPFGRSAIRGEHPERTEAEAQRIEDTQSVVEFVSQPGAITQALRECNAVLDRDLEAILASGDGGEVAGSPNPAAGVAVEPVGSQTIEPTAATPTQVACPDGCSQSFRPWAAGKASQEELSRRQQKWARVADIGTQQLLAQLGCDSQGFPAETCSPEVSGNDERSRALLEEILI